MGARKKDKKGAGSIIKAGPGRQHLPLREAHTFQIQFQIAASNAAPPSRQIVPGFSNMGGGGGGNTGNTTALLQALQMDNEVIFHNLTALYRQVTGIGSEFSEIKQTMETFRQDMDDMQWNNAQMFNDVVDLQNLKDKQRNDILALQFDVDELQEIHGIE